MKIEIKNEDHWHELRAKHVGGSEVASIFGRSSYETPWQLWQRKAGNLNEPFDEKFTRAGRYFESAIAQWAADKWDMQIHKVNDYYVDSAEPGMGATLDYATDTGEPVEIKFNHFAGEGWVFDGGELVEVPEQYVWQVQHQLACYGGEYGWLVAFVKGEPHRLRIRRSDRIIHAIRDRVGKFWQSIKDNVPPPVDLSKDGDSLSALIYMRGVRDVDMSRHEELFAQYLAFKKTGDEATASAKELKTRIMELYDEELRGVNEPTDKALVKAGRFKMVVNRVEENPGKKVTPAMVGTYVGARKGHLRASVKEVE